MGRASELRFRPSQGARPLRVLLADANSVRRARLRDDLRRDGHDVLVIVGMTQLVFALQVADDGLGPPPDVLIVDVSMGNGLILDALRANRGEIRGALLAFILPAHEAPIHADLEELEPFAVFGPSPDSDDVRTVAMNAPASARLRQARIGQHEMMGKPASDNPFHFDAAKKGEDS